MGNSYSDTSIDLGSGSGTLGGGSPRRPSSSGGGNNRHCAAWEQVQAALNIIADCMSMLGCAEAEQVRALAAGAKMEYNRGE